MQHDRPTFGFTLNDRGTGCEMHLLDEGLGDKMGGSRELMKGGKGGGVSSAYPLDHACSQYPPTPPNSSLTLFVFLFFFQMQVTVKNVLVQYLHRSGAGTGR